jgi:hypothetical protein
MKRVFVFAIVSLLGGCSGGDFETAAAGGEDSAVLDSSVDSSESDATVDSSESDTGSGAMDSTASDTGAHVDAPPPLDTGSSDPTDTGGGGMLDTGSGLPDVAGGCPAPISMAPPIDVSTWNCDQLKAAYPMKVDEAKACGCEADCNQKVWRDFCGCTTIVSPAAPAYPSLEPMRKRWEDLGCTMICPKIACKEPVLSGCFPSGTGSGVTVCTTM